MVVDWFAHALTFLGTLPKQHWIKKLLEYNTHYVLQHDHAPKFPVNTNNGALTLKDLNLPESVVKKQVVIGGVINKEPLGTVKVDNHSSPW